MTFEKIAVLGSGTMGHGIAQNFALGGYDVALYDIDDAIVHKGLDRVAESLQVFIEEEVITDEQKQRALSHITATTNLKEAVSDAQLVIECIIEKISVKHDLYKNLEKLISKDALIASNTSTFSIGQLTEVIEHKDRFAIMHYFNPAQIVPLVEILGADSVPKERLESISALLKDVGKEPVVLKKDMPGFIGNRLQAALVREAFYLYNEGVASAEDIDTVISSGPGFRWAFSGPLKTADFGGLDIWKSVVENLAPSLDDSLKIPESINELYKSNNLGTKTGSGIFTYTEESVKKEIDARDRHFLSLLKEKQKTYEDGQL